MRTSSGQFRLLSTSFGLVRVEFTDQGIRRIQLRPAQAEKDEQARPPNRDHWLADGLVRLEAYFRGEAVSFTGVPLDLEGVPRFRRRVLEACRHIPYGEFVSYQQLAARAGNGRAVRATGSAMKYNPIPIVIPCHLVLRSDGSLGGYSAPGGLELKAALLEMESAALGIKGTRRKEMDRHDRKDAASPSVEIRSKAIRTLGATRSAKHGARGALFIARKNEIMVRT